MTSSAVPPLQKQVKRIQILARVWQEILGEIEEKTRSHPLPSRARTHADLTAYWLELREMLANARRAEKENTI